MEANFFVHVNLLCLHPQGGWKEHKVDPKLYLVFGAFSIQNSLWTSSLCSVFSPGADPSLAPLTHVFKDTTCWALKKQKPTTLLNHWWTKRKAITYSSSGRDRLFAQQFPAYFHQLKCKHLSLVRLFLSFFVRKARL